MRISSRAGENGWLWLAKILTGLLVIVVLFIHLVVNHLVVEGGLMSYADVIRYLSTPGIAIMEVFFLVVVVTHSLIGLRSILTDLEFGRRNSRVIDPLLSIVGVVAIVYGIWLMVTILRQV